LIVAGRFLAPLDVEVLACNFTFVELLAGVFGFVFVIVLHKGKVPLIAEVAVAELFEFVLQVGYRRVFRNVTNK